MSKRRATGSPREGGRGHTEPATPAAPQPFGVRLRAAREARGLSLAHVAAVTKISARALEAVERNDYSRLPGGIFMRSFVRAYATEVGLDPDAALRDFLAECPTDVAAIPTNSPADIDGPRHERWHQRLPLGTMILIAAVVLAVAAGVVWLLMRGSSTGIDNRATPRPGAAMDRPHGVDSNETAPGAVATAGHGDGLTIALTARSPAWLSFAVDGRPASAHIVRRGERVLIRAEMDATLEVRDAGAFELTINGERARALGRSGEHAALRITPDSALSLLAP